MQITLKFMNKAIRVKRDKEEFKFVALDIANALNLSNPRQEIIRIVVNINSDSDMVKWGNLDLHMINFNSVLELIFVAEKSSAKEFMSWLTFNLINLSKSYDKSSNTRYAITQIAKQYNLTSVQLNSILHSEGIQYKVNDQWVLYERYQGQGFTEIVEIKKENKEGIFHTYWTHKGLMLISSVLKELGYSKNEQLKLF